MKLTLSTLEQSAFNYRGKIIDGCIEIEKSIETFISRYLTNTPEKQMQIVFLLLDRMSFDGKVSVFQEILKQVYQDEYKKRFDKFIGKIRMAKDERNIFAHYLLKIDKEAVNKCDEQLSFFSLRNKPAYMDYTYMKLDGIIDTIQVLVNAVEKMTRELSISPSE